jgi:radical SAM superfamily enzyme YgiQ (UPF0313 family)
MEEEASTRKTFEFVSKIDRFFDLTFFPLVYFPGTVLAGKAKDAGLIKEGDYLEYLSDAGWDKVKEVYKADYYTISFMLLDWFKRKFKMPVPACRILYNISTNGVVSYILRRKVFTGLLIRTYIFLLSPKFWSRKPSAKSAA